MRCPHDDAELATIRVGPTSVARCPTCRGLFGGARELEAIVSAPVVSRPLQLALAGMDEGSPALRCPACRDRLEPETLSAARDHTALVCRGCTEVWLTDGAASALRAGRASKTPATPTRAPTSGDRATLDASVFAPGPLPELGVLSAMLVLTWLFVSSRFGGTLAFGFRIQFHELGHALVAWSTGRRALPLPFGWTSWSFDRSWLLMAIQGLFTLLLVVHGARERSPKVIGAALALVTIFSVGWTTPLGASEPWLVAGGAIGEALLPALALLAFHLPLPARVRWDFWRWPLALFALIALVSIGLDDLAIARGDRPLPMGSFLSSREDDGDLSRLVNDYGWPAASLRPFLGQLGVGALVLGLVPNPIVLGLRAALIRRSASSADRSG